MIICKLKKSQASGTCINRPQLSYKYSSLWMLNPQFIARTTVLKKFAMMSQPKRRLEQLARTISTDIPQTIGTLKLGNITYHVPESAHPSLLPRSKALLDVQDSTNLDNLHFMLQKYLLGQDIFLLSQPGPYARRLALTFCR